MPYRDQATVQSWITQYLELHDRPLAIQVLDKNFESGPDSGLVIVSLQSAATIIYAHPIIEQGAPRWVVTFDPRSDSLDLDAAALTMMSQEIAALAGLCEFLQKKTDEAVLVA